MLEAPVRFANDAISAPVLIVGADDAASRPLARALANALGLPYEDATSHAPLQLIQAVSGLTLCDTAGARLRVEFTEVEIKRYRPGASGRDLLRRALGAAVHVVDATAGLGRDSVHLACLGYRVTAIERNPVVAALANDGLARARAAKLLPTDNPEWRNGDARAILPRLDPRPEAIYLDPMFPPKRKSAATRKEMRLLRALVADDEDYRELYTIACACATDRVVVKRPDDALPLAPNPSASYRGKTVRYDVYRIGHRS